MSISDWIKSQKEGTPDPEPYRSLLEMPDKFFKAIKNRGEFDRNYRHLFLTSNQYAMIKRMVDFDPELKHEIEIQQHELMADTINRLTGGEKHFHCVFCDKELIADNEPCCGEVGKIYMRIL